MKPTPHLPAQNPCALTARTNGMAVTDVAIGVIFLSQTIIGILEISISSATICCLTPGDAG